MIVGILGPGGCGGTFLDWSLHYLHGDNTYWVVPCDHRNRSIHYQPQLIKTTSNPLKGITAHNHQRAHPNNQSLNYVIDAYKLLPKDQLYTFYYVDSMLPTQTSTTHNKIIESHTDLSFITYNFSESDIDKIFCLQFEKIPGVDNKLISQLSTHDGNILELPVWDRRELLSLYYPKAIQGQTVNEIIYEHANNFQLDFEIVLNSLDLTIKDILDFLKIKIDTSRWESWCNTYSLWKQGNAVGFYQDIDKIINCIIDNIALDLTPYNMTFAKEVVIASKLLYTHNKSLKAYNIDKIPSNTQSWHDILEENVCHVL
jgi:hypothetical protein